jgi:hypothetical protein
MSENPPLWIAIKLKGDLSKLSMIIGIWKINRPQKRFLSEGLRVYNPLLLP